MRNLNRDNRLLPPEIFSQRVKNNPYLEQIYQFPEILLPHPDVLQFNERLKLVQQKHKALHVEIGCGSGRFIKGLHDRYTEDFHIGFELRYKRIVYSARKFADSSCARVLLLKENGMLLRDYFPTHSIDHVYINFPDPWPKNSQRKHRLLSNEFLEQVIEVMKPEGTIQLKTDHKDYYRWVLGNAQSCMGLSVVGKSEDLHQSEYADNNILTEFEQLFINKFKAPIYYLQVALSKLPA